MKIVYDHQTFIHQDYGGISRYFYELIKRGKLDEQNELELVLNYSNNSYLENRDISSHQNFFSNIEFRGKRRAQLMLNKYRTSLFLSCNKFDIFHPTYYDTYFLKNLKSRNFTVTFLDMIHEKFVSQYPELGNDKKLFAQKKQLIELAPKVIAISESTKIDLVDIYGVNPNKIEVIHLGNSFDANSDSGAPYLSNNYLLYVGSRQGYKNFKFCLKALKNELIQNDIILVCAGGGKFSLDEIEFINKLGLSKSVLHVGITDNLLANLYKNSIAFIFPSLYEGFGIPVLEAFACNTPCLLSNGGSLPEVGGNAALYFDPQNEESLGKSFSEIIDNVDLRSKLIEKGKIRLKNFSWENTYNSTIKFYKSIS